MAAQIVERTSKGLPLHKVGDAQKSDFGPRSTHFLKLLKFMFPRWLASIVLPLYIGPERGDDERDQGGRG